jgi:putative transposase
MAIDLRLVDKLLADYKKPEDLIGESGPLERAISAELTEHLGYAKHDPCRAQQR